MTPPPAAGACCRSELNRFAALAAERDVSRRTAPGAMPSDAASQDTVPPSRPTSSDQALALTVVFSHGSVVLRAAGRLLAADAARLLAALVWTSRTARMFTLDLSGLTGARRPDLVGLADTYRAVAEEGVELVLVAPADRSMAEAVFMAGVGMPSTAATSRG